MLPERGHMRVRTRTQSRVFFPVQERRPFQRVPDF